MYSTNILFLIKEVMNASKARIPFSYDGTYLWSQPLYVEVSIHGHLFKQYVLL
jgi:hypothetical protein